MKCPEVYSGFDGLVMSDRRRDEIITYGFVRNLWRESDINHFLFPPHYLIKIMHSYYSNEVIHLLEN